MAGEDRYLIGPVQNSFAVLEAVADAAGPLSLEDIARATRLPRTTAYRHLRTLTTLGYLLAVSGRLYEIGPAAAFLAGAGAADRALRALAKDEMVQLHGAWPYTVNLGVARGRRIEYVSVLDMPRRNDTTMVEPGDSDHVHSTALGKAIMAYLPPGERERHLHRRLPRLTRSTTTNRHQLDGLLSQVRRFGYALDRGENEEGCVCVAAPIMAGSSRPLAAISVSAPLSAIGPAAELQLADAVSRSAGRLSARLARSRPS